MRYEILELESSDGLVWKFLLLRKFGNRLGECDWSRGAASTGRGGLEHRTEGWELAELAELRRLVRCKCSKPRRAVRLVAITAAIRVIGICDVQSAAMRDQDRGRKRAIPRSTRGMGFITLPPRVAKMKSFHQESVKERRCVKCAACFRSRNRSRGRGRSQSEIKILALWSGTG